MRSVALLVLIALAARADVGPAAAPTGTAAVASVATGGLANAELAGPQYTFTALWCGGFLVAAAAPFVLGLYPEADSMDGPLVGSTVVDALRVFLPYFTVFLDMMQISAVAFLPSIGWDGDWTFFR